MVIAQQAAEREKREQEEQRAEQARLEEEAKQLRQQEEREAALQAEKDAGIPYIGRAALMPRARLARMAWRNPAGHIKRTERSSK